MESVLFHPKARSFPALKRDYDRGGSAIPQAFTAAENIAGAVVWIQSYMEPLHFDAAPTPAQRSVQSVSLFAALGENEPIGLAVRSLEMPTTITIKISDLKNPTHTISHEHIITRLSLGYEARYSRRTSNQIYRQMVLLKPPHGQWRFAKRYSHVYIVDIHVPLNATPGLYRGTITVKADKRPIKTLTMHLDVLPYSLKTNNFHAGGFGCTYNTWTGGFTLITRG